MLIGAGVLEATAQPLHALTTALEKILGRPVVDMTYLTGAYDFRVTFAADVVPLNPDDAAGPVPDTPSIFTALQEQLGLRIERRRGPVDVLVIEGVALPAAD
jgi:uncharacterized protein (TIGR03435 family)